MAIHDLQAFALGGQVGTASVGGENQGREGNGEEIVAFPGHPRIHAALVGFADVGDVLPRSQIQRGEAVGRVRGIVGGMREE